jgi:hypothetical protein
VRPFQRQEIEIQQSSNRDSFSVGKKNLIPKNNLAKEKMFEICLWNITGSYSQSTISTVRSAPRDKSFHNKRSI